jgi:hypothetical protein
VTFVKFVKNYRFSRDLFESLDGEV